VEHFHTSGYMPHGYCYLWDPWILGLHVASDGLIVLSYYCIPIALVYLIRKRQDLPFNWIFWMFGLFILGCGTTHLLEIWTVWHASYFLSGIIKALTAAVSVMTAVMLVPLIPRAVAFPSFEQLHNVNALLEAQVERRAQTEQQLRETLVLRERAYAELAQQKSTVAELRAAQEALKESEDRFRGVIESALDAVITIDTQQQVVMFNDAAGKMFGCSPEEAVGKNIDRFIPLRFRKSHKEHVVNFSQTGVTSRDMGAANTVSGLRANGQEFPIEASISQLAVGAEKLYTVILRDITERQRSQSDLLQQREELSRSNRDLEQFAYAASHDLQEPLRAVAGCVDLLKQRYHSQIDAHADEFITHAIDGATRMQKLIDDLLMFSRVGTHGAEFQAVDCADALDGALHNLTISIKETRAVIDTGPLPRVKGDLSQLSLVFQNLIANAIKFRGDTQPVITLRSKWAGGEWLISVTDNGIGIDQKYFDRIFVIFQRLHTRKEYPGTGMGLALSKKIVERHGGKMWVESGPGHGTTFHFTLHAFDVSNSLPNDTPVETNAC
jgi:PAS domain S-box-containing protein